MLLEGIGLGLHIEKESPLSLQKFSSALLALFMEVKRPNLANTSILVTRRVSFVVG